MAKKVVLLPPARTKYGVRLNSIDDARRVMQKFINSNLKGEVDNQQLTALTGAMRVLMGIFEVIEVQRGIEDIKRLLDEKQVQLPVSGTAESNRGTLR